MSPGLYQRRKFSKRSRNTAGTEVHRFFYTEGHMKVSTGKMMQISKASLKTSRKEDISKNLSVNTRLPRESQVTLPNVLPFSGCFPPVLLRSFLLGRILSSTGVSTGITIAPSPHSWLPNNDLGKGTNASRISHQQNGTRPTTAKRIASQFLRQGFPVTKKTAQVAVPALFLRL